jgi:hypothetical protein
VPIRRIAIAWLCALTLALAQKPPARVSAQAKPGSAAVVPPEQTPVAAKAAAPEARKRQVKVFDIKYASPDALADMVNDLRHGSSPDKAIPQPSLHAIAVEAYSTAFLQSAQELIQRFDVPEMSVAQNHDFEIVAHILAASRTPIAGDALPKELEAAAKQLKETFGYTDVKLVDSAIEHCREGRDAFTKGNVSGLSDGAVAPSSYEMTHRIVRYEPGAKSGSVTLYGFQFKLRLAYQPAGQTTGPTQWQDVTFQTDLNIPEGQSVVVGKSKIGTEEKSVVLVLQVRVAG